MKPWKMASLILLAALIGGIVYGTVVVRRGFSARGTPSLVEKIVATTARNLAVPFAYRQLHNPLATSSENIQAGMAHFADHCATCHGNDGGGDTVFGRGLYPRPPDMRKPETQDESDGELYYTIENGVRLSGMPAFGEQVGTDDLDTWKLVVFIRHLPNLTNQELIAMEGLNPKTDDERQEEKNEQDFLNGGNSPIPDNSPHHH